jgi:hypothetical protein
MKKIGKPQSLETAKKVQKATSNSDSDDMPIIEAKQIKSKKVQPKTKAKVESTSSTESDESAISKLKKFRAVLKKPKKVESEEEDSSEPVEDEETEEVENDDSDSVSTPRSRQSDASEAPEEDGEEEEEEVENDVEDEEISDDSPPKAKAAPKKKAAAKTDKPAVPPPSDEVIKARYQWLKAQMQQGPIPVRSTNPKLNAYKFLWTYVSPDLRKTRWDYDGTPYPNPTMPLRKIHEEEGITVKPSSIKGWSDAEAFIKRSLKAEKAEW